MDYALVLPADRVILEVAALALPDTALVEATRELAAQGYRLTLKTHRDMVALHRASARQLLTALKSKI
jgi:c-di-GMP-related signal transduction protein